MRTDWVAIVPLKPASRAKSRLGLTDQQRPVLARAFAADVVAALAGVDRIATICVVVDATEDLVLADQVLRVVDPGTGLNEALRAAAGPWGPATPVVAVMADLPAARTEDFDRLLDGLDPLPGGGAFVADAEGIGTTALAGSAGTFDPHFGRRSSAAHRQAGAVAVTAAGLTRLRRDVDSVVDLADALRLGVGPATSAAVEELGLRTD